MLPSPELIAKIQELRRKSNDGTLTLEEQKEAILLLRQDRRTVTSTPAKKGGSKKKAPVNADALLGELDNL